MVVKGRIENGVVVYASDTTLPEGAEVEITIGDAALSGDAPLGQRERLGEKLMRYAGMIDDMPEDASEQLDHYLYGTPKR